MELCTSEKEMTISDWELVRIGKFQKHMVVPLYGSGYSNIVGRGTLVRDSQRIVSSLVSRKHASLHVEDADGCYIIDLKSLNGIYVNGKRIKPDFQHYLHNGDRIGIGVPNGLKEDHFEFKLLRKSLSTFLEKNKSNDRYQNILHINNTSYNNEISKETTESNFIVRTQNVNVGVSHSSTSQDICMKNTINSNTGSVRQRSLWVDEGSSSIDIDQNIFNKSSSPLQLHSWLSISEGVGKIKQINDICDTQRTNKRINHMYACGRTERPVSIITFHNNPQCTDYSKEKSEICGEQKINNHNSHADISNQLQEFSQVNSFQSGHNSKQKQLINAEVCSLRTPCALLPCKVLLKKWNPKDYLSVTVDQRETFSNLENTLNQSSTSSDNEVNILKTKIKEMRPCVIESDVSNDSLPSRPTLSHSVFSQKSNFKRDNGQMLGSLHCISDSHVQMLDVDQKMVITDKKNSPVDESKVENITVKKECFPVDEIKIENITVKKECFPVDEIKIENVIAEKKNSVEEIKIENRLASFTPRCFVSSVQNEEIILEDAKEKRIVIKQEENIKCEDRTAFVQSGNFSGTIENTYMRIKYVDLHKHVCTREPDENNANDISTIESKNPVSKQIKEVLSEEKKVSCIKIEPGDFYSQQDEVILISDDEEYCASQSSSCLPSKELESLKCDSLSEDSDDEIIVLEDKSFEILDEFLPENDQENKKFEEDEKETKDVNLLVSSDGVTLMEKKDILQNVTQDTEFESNVALETVDDMPLQNVENKIMEIEEQLRKRLKWEREEKNENSQTKQDKNKLSTLEYDSFSDKSQKTKSVLPGCKIDGEYINIKDNEIYSENHNMDNFDDFFPELSQEFYAEDAESKESNKDIPETSICKSSSLVNTESGFSANKPLVCVEPLPKYFDQRLEDFRQRQNQKRSSQTKLTEPLPMLCQEERSCGRRIQLKEPQNTFNLEERGISKYTYFNKDPVKNQRKVIQTAFNANSVKRTENTFYCANRKKIEVLKRKSKTKSCRQKIMEQMNYRIRMPGGGSAVKKINEDNGVHTSRIKQRSRKTLRKWSEMDKKTTSFLHSVTQKTDNMVVKNTDNKYATKKDKNFERFRSRSSFLAECPSNQNKEINKSTVSYTTDPALKKRKQSSSDYLDNFKIPRLSKSSVDENNKLTTETNGIKSCVDEDVICKGKSVNEPKKRISHLSKQNYCLSEVPEHLKSMLEHEAQVIKQLKLQSNCQKVISHKKQKVRFADAEGKELVENYFIENCFEEGCKPAYSIPSTSKVEQQHQTFSSTVLVNTHPTVSLNADKALLIMLKWFSRWFKEQEHRNHPPTMKDMKVCELDGYPQETHAYYESIDEYIKVNFSLLLYEAWEQAYQSWKEGTAKNTLITHLVEVRSYHPEEIFLRITCVTVINTELIKKDFIPVEGHFVLFDLRSTSGQLTQVFGYVVGREIQPYNPQRQKNIRTVLKVDDTKVSNKDRHLLIFTIRTKYMAESIDQRKLSKVQILCYMRPLLRQFEALSNIHKSLLVRDILQPRTTVCELIAPKHTTFVNDGFNETQAKVIISLTEQILRPYPIPLITLLQGPPGTGKTYLIVGLIQNLLHRCSSLSVTMSSKLLVVAPSNAAVDEIARRLIKLKEREKLKGKKVKFVRIGQPSHIHPEVHMYHIENLVNMNINRKLSEEKKKLEDKIRRYKATSEELATDIQKRKKDGCPQLVVQKYDAEYTKHLKQLQVLENKMKELSIRKHVSEKHKESEFRKDILQNADIILSTLSSCRMNALEVAYGKESKVHFTCCIVDEASQCSEPEMLIPLQYGITKLVLVGDPQQLPATVISKRAYQYKLQTSLFERFYCYFQTKCVNPVCMLTEQYRMHSEICMFPSKHFYQNRLKTVPSVDHLSLSFPLIPYSLINILGSKEISTQGGNISNLPEANFIMDLCANLLLLVPEGTTCGIITPYQSQKVLFQQLLRTNRETKKLKSYIEVNTVDGFQGREKDVIILSCVRAHNNTGTIGFVASPQRLNVACTRAKKTLIICGHLNSFQTHKHWQELIENGKERELLIEVNLSTDITSVLNKLLKHSV
ncbi:LOW QUALITY PROTEIN: uncharacterized protein LOC143252039 [Tachypleus tridentatus]|uniref:LOW QUALITY PROTEIN: uncharacterized protein LOC143252039 n=1 Tax=Tachypleus tridentatus TaxID=6853 RepID=UPI003FD01C7A